MKQRLTRLLLAAAVTVGVVANASVSRAQAGAAGAQLLDVPFLPQSEALCGGAAAAMVMRYWGATGVYAETFSPLVDRNAGGIRGEDLLRELHARGWDARSFRGDAALVQQQLSARRPIIALIEDRPGRYHYVVIVGWVDGRVILHDPARAPFRVIQADRFIRAWEPAGFWAMLATRPAGASVPGDPRKAIDGLPISHADAPCRGLVEEGIRLAGAGEIDEARTAFQVAESNCPDSPGPWRELAGLHALREEWSDAASAARQALARDNRDDQAARILATALYLEGDADGALRAWNLVGEPRIDIVNIRGLERTRHAVAAGSARLEPGAILTPGALERARRRLGELPAAQLTRIDYTPGDEGRAQVNAVVVERPLAPTALVPLAATGARMLTDREVGVTIASPSGGGEAWRASWRWWEHRPRVALAFEAPAPFGGTWGVGAALERQTYESVGIRTEEERRTALLRVADWTPQGLRWEVTAGIDAFHGVDRSATAGVTVEQRVFGDRVALRAGAAVWSLEGGVWTVGVGGEWRSSVRRERTTWLARGGVSLAAPRAPLALWPGAGTGQGRDLLLRAHPLLHGGIVRNAVFGRQVFDGGAEWRRWRTTGRGLVRIAPAFFVDSARAFDGLADSNSRWQVDAGAGVRLAVPGSGVLRVDLARGLRDGGFVLSAGWTK